MTEPVNVFIPAAGLGERLQPLTFHIPKPLLPVSGKPVLEIVLERVLTLPVKKIGINLHYKGEVIEDWLSRSAFREKVVLFREEPVLGTGGALKNAESLLSGGIFLVHNSDILSDIDLERLVRFHRSSGNIATLAVHDFPKFNTVRVDSEGLLKGVGPVYRTGRDSSVNAPRPEKRLAFTGIAVYDPRFLRFIPRGASGVVEAWIAAVGAGEKIGTVEVKDPYWTDIGTPSAYAAAVVRRLKSEGETIFVHPSASGCLEAEMDGYVVMEEGSLVKRGASIRNCILLPGSKIAEGASLDNCIVGPGFVVPFEEGETLGSPAGGHLILIGTGGSDRKYYRRQEEGRSSVLVRYGNAETDFLTHLAYSRFLREAGVPVPALLGEDSRAHEAVFEDLGDLSLYSWLKCPRQAEEVETLYRKVIDIAVMIHTAATRRLSECPLLRERVFDYDHLRWETGYFIENFITRIMQMAVKNASSLEEEFHRLAVKVDSFSKTVIHRDFQSQNIMVTRGGVPRVIDYQGARIGPPAYDLASLLWDPYHGIRETVRERLLNYYVRCMRENDAGGFNEKAFRATLLPCRLQRHMQALGAYGFLSSVKGKKYFLKYAGEGLRLLREDVSMVKDEYPALYKLVFRISGRGCLDEL